MLPLPDGRAVPLVLRRRAGMKRLVLRVDRAVGGIVASGPPRTSDRALIELAQANLDWIARHTSQPAKAALAEGDMIAIRGLPHQIVRGTGRGGARIDAAGAGEPPQLVLATRKGAVAPAVRAALKTLAQSDALAHLTRLEAISGLAPKALAFRDTRSRWGSCTSDGRIMLSWRLIQAPPAVFAYVIAHELAHLRELNHGPRFWAQVEAMMPDWKVQRRWLKTHGHTLHASGV